MQYLMVTGGEARTKRVRVRAGAHLLMHGALAFIYVWGPKSRSEKERLKGSTFGCLLGSFVSKPKTKGN